jgi:pimeloyl-ACP methyl ester carboxylesterase
MSNAFQRAIEDAHLPLGVEVFEWTHGQGRILADQMDAAHARAEGLQLAGQVVSYRRHYPGGEVYLVGHSAGCAVILAAVEALPPNMVDRIILLAPSVSVDYDLRPALRNCRDGIDVFCSPRDVGYLGVGVSLIGTADRRWRPAAGRVGFCPQGVTAEERALYAKLRQHPWDPCLDWSDNHGGHFGTYQPIYLRAYVLPLLTRASPCVVGP